MGNSTFSRNAILDAQFNSTAFSVTGDIWVSLHTGDPGTTGASEVAGGSYARQQAAFPASSSGSLANSAAIEFTLPAAVVTHVGFWSAVSGGNFIKGGALDASKTFLSGEVGRFAAGALVSTET